MKLMLRLCALRQLSTSRQGAHPVMHGHHQRHFVPARARRRLVGNHVEPGSIGGDILNIDVHGFQTERFSRDERSDCRGLRLVGSTAGGFRGACYLHDRR